jgi:hypothetical protein
MNVDLILRRFRQISLDNEKTWSRQRPLPDLFTVCGSSQGDRMTLRSMTADP